MKNFLLSSLFITIASFSFGQSSEKTCIPMIGDPAPSFTATSTKGEISFPADYFGKWKIFCSHPADFTPVCSSEMISLAEMNSEFKKLKTQVIVISTDGLNSHQEWIRSMESIVLPNNKSVKIDFPIISDVGLDVSKKYGMIHPNYSTTKDVRAVFIIDDQDKIRAIFYYPQGTGRNMDEIKRTLIALQTADNKYVLTPANWKPGDDVMIPCPASPEESKKMAEKNDKDMYNLTWYMWFKKMKQ